MSKWYEQIMDTDLTNIDMLELIDELFGVIMVSTEALEQNEEVDFDDKSAELSIGYDEEGKEHFISVDDFCTFVSTREVISNILRKED